MKAAKPPVCVLTIAGSDSGAGAGVQADARVIHALGAYACTAITAITAQNTCGVRAWRAVPADLLVAQIEAVLDDFPIRAIKTGLLPASAVKAVSQILKRYPRVPLVVDPVIGSTSGTRFLSDAGVRILQRELLPRAALVTPNWPEAEILSGRRITLIEDAEEAARKILESGCDAVLVKGGHAPGGRCCDVLVTAAGQAKRFESARVKTSNTHGTGCVLSAAVASELAQGTSIDDAVAHAKRFLVKSLRRSAAVRWRGRGAAFPDLGNA